MAIIPDMADPTLAALDRELERAAAAEPARNYLGASQIGHECERFLWYSLRPDVPRRSFQAATLRRFADGHAGEAVMIERLRLVPGIELWDRDEQGKQFGFTDFAGRFAGHVDGVILGLLQAPGTPHIFEGKVVNEKKFQEFKKLKREYGEKAALKLWTLSITLKLSFTCTIST